MEQEQLLKYTIDVLEKNGLSYMVVGSMASMAYSTPRLTMDIDIVIDLPLPQVSALVAAFPMDNGEYYCHEPSIAEAVRTCSQFNILDFKSGGKLDFMPVRRDAYGIEEFSRRKRVWLTPSIEGFAASPEDVVIGKLWYYKIGESEKHLRDITGLLRSANVDGDYLLNWIRQLDLQQAYEDLKAYSARLDNPDRRSL